MIYAGATVIKKRDKKETDPKGRFLTELKKLPNFEGDFGTVRAVRDGIRERQLKVVRQFYLLFRKLLPTGTVSVY